MTSRGLRALCAAIVVLCGPWVARAQTVVYVNASAAPPGDGTSWATAYTYLAAALSEAAVLADLGDTVQVWVATGTYLPDQSDANPAGGLDDDATFTMHNSVGIYGGFAGTETSLNQRDPAANPAELHGFLRDEIFGTLHVVTASNVNASAVLDGVTVTNTRLLGVRGKGLSLIDSTARIVGCTVKLIKNQNGPDGAGAYCSGGRPVFEDCLFQSNTTTPPDWSGAAISAPGTDLEIRRCVFDGNTADGAGGAVYCTGAAALIEDSVFTANKTNDGDGGAMFLAPGALVRRCVFFQNEAYFTSGAVFSGGQIENCIFTQNSSHASGGMVSPNAAGGAAVYANCVFDSNGQSGGLGFGALGLAAAARAVNCTFSNNTMADILVYGVDASVANCILYKAPGATPTEESHIKFVNPASVTVSNSFLQGLGGLYSGNGNIGGSALLRPRFADPDGPDNLLGTLDDDLRLRSGSHCIDAGDNTALPVAVVLDALGLARFVDDPGMPDAGVGPAPVVDMGAYEFSGTSCLADFNDDGFIDPLDFNGFINAYEAADTAADFNRDGFLDPLDYNGFINAFETGC